MSIALLGTGYWGKNIARVLSEENILHSVCENNVALGKEFAETYEVPVLTFEQLLKSDCVAIAIALPAELHFSYAKQALLAGKHVFVEKPLTLSVQDSETLLELADRNRLKLMVGHILQYHNAFIKFKEMLLKGDFGRLRHISATRDAFGKIRTNEDVLWSFAPHDISMVLSVVQSEITAVSGSKNAFLQKNIADTINMQLCFKNGCTADIHCSWFSPIKKQLLVATTEQALIVFDDTESWEKKLKIIEYSTEKNTNSLSLKKDAEQFLEVRPNEPLKSELRHFWSMICEDKNESPSGAIEGLKVVEVLAQASANLRQV